MRDEFLWVAVFMNNIIGDFSDIPKTALSRSPKNISIPEDKIGELFHYDQVLRNSVSEYTGSKTEKLIRNIEILVKDENGKESEFWTNKGFEADIKWQEIRKICRHYLLDKFEN